MLSGIRPHAGIRPSPSVRPPGSNQSMNSSTVAPARQVLEEGVHWQPALGEYPVAAVPVGDALDAGAGTPVDHVVISSWAIGWWSRYRGSGSRSPCGVVSIQLQRSVRGSRVDGLRRGPAVRGPCPLSFLALYLPSVLPCPGSLRPGPLRRFRSCRNSSRVAPDRARASVTSAS